MHNNNNKLLLSTKKIKRRGAINTHFEVKEILKNLYSFNQIIIRFIWWNIFALIVRTSLLV